MRCLLFLAVACALCSATHAGLRMQVSSPHPTGVYETVWHFSGSDVAGVAGFVQPGAIAAWHSGDILGDVNPGNGAGYLTETESYIGTPYPPAHELWPQFYNEPSHDHFREAWLINETTGEHSVITHVLTDYIDDRMGFAVAQEFVWNAGDTIALEGDVWVDLPLGYFNIYGELLPISKPLEDFDILAAGSLPPLHLAIVAPGDLPLPSTSAGTPEVLLSGQTPEPSAFVLAGLALIGVGLLRRHSIRALST